MKGLQLIITGNDFIDTNELASIEQVKPESEELLLRLKTPLQKGGRRYVFAIAKPRLATGQIEHLPRGKTLGCAITWVPAEHFRIDDPFDLSWWRGGAAAIADLKAL
jgi:hypothetical protein